MQLHNQFIKQLSNKGETQHFDSELLIFFKKVSSVICRIRMPFWHFFMFPRLEHDGNWKGPQVTTAEEGFLYLNRLQGCPKVRKITYSSHNISCCYFVFGSTVTFQQTVHSQHTGKEVTGITGHLVKQFGSFRLSFVLQPFYTSRDTFLCYLCNVNKPRSALEHHMLKMRQKAAYMIEI